MTSDASGDLQARLERLERENAKLRTIRDALMERVDSARDYRGNGRRAAPSAGELEPGVEKRIQRLARAVSEAKIARRQLQQAIDSIGEGFILYDNQDRIVLCNRNYRAMFPQLAHLLQPGTQFADLIRCAAEADIFAEAVTDPQAWIALRQQHHRIARGQFQHMLRDGRWIQISETSTDQGGRVTTVSDVTHFRRLEERQRLADVAGHSNLLARTVASIAQGVAVFDKRSKLVTWNSQAALVLNLPYVAIQPGMSIRALRRIARRQGVMLSGEANAKVVDWIAREGARYPLRVELRTPGDRCVAANFRDMPEDGFVVTMTDVSAQIMAARQLERSNEELERHVQERTAELRKLNTALEDEIRHRRSTAADLERMRAMAEAANLGKTRFLAAASHDLLQPLNAARLYLSALETSPFIKPGGREFLDNIVHAFESIETLLNTLLDISKMDAGGYSPKLTAVSLGDLFETLRTEFVAMARHKGLRLRSVHTSAVVWSDARLLRSVVQNVLSNAIKYTETGTVLFGVKRRNGALAIEIHDTGPGIAAEDHQVIFEEFRRLKSTARQTSGLGLGLATVKRAAALLEYRILVHSILGRGSRFSILVPPHCAADAPAVIAPRVEESAALAKPAAPDAEGVLFVLENDEEVASAMTMLFEQWKLKSVIAPSHAAIVEMMRRERLVPKIVIADLHLDEGIDGIEAIRLLREEVGFPVPGVLVTADQSRQIQERAKAHEIEYFSKPLKPAQLRAYFLHLSAATQSTSRLAPGASVNSGA